MKRVRLLIALIAVAALAGFATAGEEQKTATVTGKIVCAKCSLQKADAKACQNVIVAEENGKAVEYYLAKNALTEEFGHVCKGEKNVVATGTVSEKDGKLWLTATKMEEPKTLSE
jgi:type 1 fimbria pilin